MIDTADRLAIDDVLARYGWAFDQGDGDAYAALFTENGVLSGFGDPFRGRAALAALAAGTLVQSNGKWRHHLTNLVLRYGRDRDEVEARGYQLVTDWNTIPPAPRMMLEPRWTLVRNGGEWQIAAVELHIVGPAA